VLDLGRPVIERMIGVPVPRDEVFAAAERLLSRLDLVHRLLADPERSSVRLVLALEQLAIVEARRSFTYFHLFGYPSDLVICNRVMPETVGGYFAGLRETQQAYLPKVTDDFAPVPVRTVPFFDREVIGADGLREIGRALFGDDDPAGFFYRGRPYRIRTEGNRHVLDVALPFTSREEVGLSRDGDELVISVGAWRRTLVLPRALVDSPTTGAKMDGGILHIEFSARARARKKEADHG